MSRWGVLFFLCAVIVDAQPNWADQEMTCGLWSGNWADIKYSAASYDLGRQRWCGYCFFRDYLSIALESCFFFVLLMCLAGWMPLYWKYMNEHVDFYVGSLLNIVTCGGRCCGMNSKDNDGSSSSGMNSKADDGSGCWRMLRPVMFFVFGSAVVILAPELALAYHVFVGLNCIGGTGRPSLPCCGQDKAVTVAVNNATTDTGAVGPEASRPVASRYNNSINDPLSLRPRIQFVTKYKPVPLSPPNP